MSEESQLAAEQRARVLIDRQLNDAGWVVQDRKSLNLFAGPGVAVREVAMAKGHGRADYLLYVDQHAVGVIEAKPVGSTLSGVEWQSASYAEGLPPDVRLKAVTRASTSVHIPSRPYGERHSDIGQWEAPRQREPGAVARPVAIPDERSRPPRGKRVLSLGGQGCQIAASCAKTTRRGSNARSRSIHDGGRGKGAS